MKISTMQDNKNGGKMKLWAVCFWLIVWQFASMQIGQEILLVSPVSVIQCLIREIQTPEFWHSIVSSLCKIALGFLIAFSTGILAAILSKVSRLIRDVLQPPVQVMKSVPVASFIILCLVWIPSKNLSIFISFIMVFPIIYSNTLQGIERTDRELLEMGALFDIPWHRRIRYIYLSEVMPYVTTASSVALGMCWKAGIAAEVIGIPKGSIGEKLYQAKIYLNTPELFAWTVVIIIISVLFERSVLALLHGITKRLERI
ncbi:MAG: ABC transporter permease subunit [Lachnospiraceae bacterium]|nr:ABC transporter permease subunit [Lachnospiraceae bacterium]